MSKSQVIFLDIETSPSLGWTWGPKWETSIIEFKQNWHLLSFSYKVEGERKIQVRCLADYPNYSKDKENDKALVADLWTVFDEADVIIGHNAEKFDIKKANARFLVHKVNPPSPYKVVDTLKIARRAFKLDSNKLDDLGNYLGVGRKLPHTGFHLWLNCMSGDLKSWALMKKYNAQDVALLERVYYAVRGWALTYPNLNKGQSEVCPNCGSDKTQRRGFSYTPLRMKQRLQCLNCASWFYGSARKVD